MHRTRQRQAVSRSRLQPHHVPIATRGPSALSVSPRSIVSADHRTTALEPLHIYRLRFITHIRHHACAQKPAAQIYVKQLKLTQPYHAVLRFLTSATPPLSAAPSLLTAVASQSHRQRSRFRKALSANIMLSPPRCFTSKEGVNNMAAT